MRCLMPMCLALGILLGCGGSSSTGNSGAPVGGTGGSAPVTGTSASVNVHLVDGPTTAYKAIYLDITQVEISQDGASWITLATLDRAPINILSLTGGVSETLAQGATLTAGSYGQMRLILAPTGNSIVLDDGSSHDLKIPSGAQTGIKLVGDFVVQTGTTADIFIDFDGAHSIQVVKAGHSGKYILRPTVRAFELAVTGSISGTLTDADGNAPLAGAEVMAEVLDGSGNPSVARHTTTDGSGHYTLDLLPVGSTYYVVSLPVTAGPPMKVYDPRASDGFALSPATPLFTYDAAFTQDAALGEVDGMLTPVAGAEQSDEVDLQATLGGHLFILDATMAVVDTTQETFSFPDLPAGPYDLVALRTTTPASGPATVQASGSVPAAVVASSTLDVVIGFSGTVSGTLTNAADHSALSGVEVMAETFDASGNPVVLQSGQTDSAGHYTLGMLPVGSTFHVVSLPVTGISPAVMVFDPEASDGMTVTAGNPVFAFDQMFTLDTHVGAIAGTVTPLPGAGQTDTIDLLAQVPTQTQGSMTFLAATALPAAGAFSFPYLPAGGYTLVGDRNTAGATPPDQLSAAVPVTVTDGGTAAAAVAF